MDGIENTKFGFQERCQNFPYKYCNAQVNAGISRDFEVLYCANFHRPLFDNVLLGFFIDSKETVLFMCECAALAFYWLFKY